MPPITLDVAADNATVTLGEGASAITLSGQEVDDLIRRLATARARMTPVHPATPPADPRHTHAGDNLLWAVRAVPDQLALEFATQHPGLGWTVMLFSRAQVEDLQTNIEFELLKLPQRA
jgi:hypothetical protein